MDDMDELTDCIWNSLDKDNRISLFVRYVDLKTGQTETTITNKYNC